MHSSQGRSTLAVPGQELKPIKPLTLIQRSLRKRPKRFDSRHHQFSSVSVSARCSSTSSSGAPSGSGACCREFPGGRRVSGEGHYWRRRWRADPHRPPAAPCRVRKPAITDRQRPAPRVSLDGLQTSERPGTRGRRRTARTGGDICSEITSVGVRDPGMWRWVAARGMDPLVAHLIWESGWTHSADVADALMSAARSSGEIKLLKSI